MLRPRRRIRLLPVVILAGATGLACGPSHGFDSASGCCLSCVNAGGCSYNDCPDTGTHAKATCDDPNRPPDYPTDEDWDGFGPEDGDCDDTDAAISPAAKERCDGLDNDCDGSIDEGAMISAYADADGDGYGDPTRPEDTCPGDRNKIYNSADCDDTKATVHPGAYDSCNGIDDDCDGTIDFPECP